MAAVARKVTFGHADVYIDETAAGGRVTGAVESEAQTAVAGGVGASGGLILMEMWTFLALE